LDVIYHFYCILLLAYIPYGWPISPISPMQCFYRPLADWSTRGLDNSQSRMPPKERKLNTQSRWWHTRVVQSATCPVRELSSLRVDQSARCPVRESSSPRVGNPRVGVSASCPVTISHVPFRERNVL